MATEASGALIQILLVLKISVATVQEKQLKLQDIE